MRVRIKFAKYGTMKYIGHLDFMRFFMKSIRRAALPIKYTSGFHPHPIMSFALPLGVGVTSTGEYMDMDLTEAVPATKIRDSLQAQMPEGVDILDVIFLEDDAKKVMAEVEAADYFVIYKKNPPKCSAQEVASNVTDFMDLSQILVEKESKKGTRTVDLKPFIYHLEAFPLKDLSDDWLKCHILCEAFCSKEEDIGYRMQVSSGSNDNIKPELLLSAFHRHLGISDEEPLALSVHRSELYKIKDNAFVPLSLV